MIAERIVLNGGRRIKEEDLKWAYHTIIGQVMRETGKNEIALGGGCGGSVVRSSDLFGSESPIEKAMEVPNLSSSYRRQIQGEGKSSESSNRYDDYNCPKCGATIKGEVKDSAPETWKQKCDCGFEFHCGK